MDLRIGAGRTLAVVVLLAICSSVAAQTAATSGKKQPNLPLVFVKAMCCCAIAARQSVSDFHSPRTRSIPRSAVRSRIFAGLGESHAAVMPSQQLSMIRAVNDPWSTCRGLMNPRAASSLPLPTKLK